MRALTSLNFGLLGPLTVVLGALERLKNTHRLIMDKTMSVPTFSRLCLIGSFSYLQVMITYMRAWMGLKFGLIQPPVSMVTDRVMMGKNGVSTFSRLFFIRSFSYLQVTMTCMRARTSSNFGLIGPLTKELAALERLIKSP